MYSDKINKPLNTMYSDKINKPLNTMYSDPDEGKHQIETHQQL